MQLSFNMKKLLNYALLLYTESHSSLAYLC